MELYVSFVHDLDLIKINECLVTKYLLMNVTTFVHALIHTQVLVTNADNQYIHICMYLILPS